MKYIKQIIMSVMLIALSTTWGNADTVSIETIGDRDGHAWNSGADTNDIKIYVGDPHSSLVYHDSGVFKYDLPTVLDSKTVNNATLNVRVVYMSEEPIWILLQKYTFDNTTAVSLDDSDYHTSSVINIGVLSAIPNDWIQWDITSALQSDINSGYDYSSYRLLAVTSETNLTPVQLTGVHVIALESQEGPNGLEPRLDVDYNPVLFSTSIETVGDWDGYAWSSDERTTNDIIYVGDASPTLVYHDSGVFKYDLPSVLDDKAVNSATLNVRVVYMSEDPIWILLQKYTFDNTTAVSSADSDYNTSAVINIGVLSAVPNDWIQWDITSALQSDINSGYDYSSYRLLAVTSETDFTPVQLTGTHVVALESQEGPNGLEPRLDVIYHIPPRGTLLVLQ